MNEGWSGSEYIVLLSQAESVAAMAKYQFEKYLPGFTLVGLRGWDDFIVIDPRGAMCSLPTIPLDASHVEPFHLPESLSLKPDARFAGKIKWYLTPLVFGGDAQEKSNLAWLSHDRHAEMVVWWNAKYAEFKSGGAGA